jgi:hypothetical protein
VSDGPFQVTFGEDYKKGLGILKVFKEIENE